MFSNEQWLANSGGDFYNGVATQSLRFERGGSAYLTRTPSSASNRKTWTWSAWVKRSNFIDGSNALFNAGSGTASFISRFEPNDTLRSYDYNGSFQLLADTPGVFRDVSSWYHIVFKWDTTQGTASDRYVVYINGVNQNVGSTFPSQNYDGFLNTAVAHTIGQNSVSTFDGYMAEINFIDGQALTPTSFGEFKNGVWIPVDTSGLTFGTNGFRLQFKETGVGTASTTTIGADTSGNTNHFTSSGIVASDCAMPDSPENNFCTWNPLSKGAGTSTAEGNLKAIYSSNNQAGISSTFSVDTGKYYFEVGCQTGSVFIGVAPSTYKNPANINSTTGSIHYASNGNKSLAGTQTSYGASYGNGDVIGVALNLDDGEVTFYKNNSSQGALSLTSGLSYGISSASGSSTSTFTVILNSGQDSSFAGTETAQGNTDGNDIGDFYYAPPSGFLALCTANLPEPTIGANSDTQADDYFNTVLYTGDNNARSIDDVGFQPDWLWTKSRSNAESHRLHDSSRGDNGTVMYELNSDNTEAEGTDTLVTGFDALGFNIAAGGNTPNVSGRTYVAWNWKANGGTTSSNTDGSITSTVQANTDAGFSIVSYTGTGSNATVGHGLSSVDMMIIKNRDDSANWITWHIAYSGGSYFQELNTTDGKNTSSTPFNGTEPNGTVLALGTNNATNGSADDMIAYCFHSVEGYSKFGSYTGNGNADGTFVFVGFAVKYLMVKRTDAVGTWRVVDTSRSTSNVTNDSLAPNESSAELVNNTSIEWDLLSNGFKCRDAYGDLNASGGSYIYMAFAEAPFKYANAR